MKTSAKMNAIEWTQGGLPDPGASGAFEDQYIQVGAIKARYWSAGTHGTPVLFIHGMGASTQLWRPALDALAPHRRVFAVDLPGFGLTDKPDAPYTLDYMVTFIRDFLDALGLAHVSVIGHSFGGAVAVRFALDFPERVVRLALVAPASLGPRMNPLFRLMTLPILGELFSLPSRPGMAFLLRLCAYERHAVTPEIIEQSYQLAILPGAQRGLLRTLRALATLRGQRREIVETTLTRLREIAVPTLVLWGEQDSIVPNSAPAARAIKSVRVETWEECGHLPWIEHTTRFNLLLVDFLTA